MNFKIKRTYKAIVVELENGITDNPTDSMLLIDFRFFMSYVLEACVLIAEGQHPYPYIVKKITEQMVEQSYTFPQLQTFNFCIESVAQTYLEEGIEALQRILRVTGYHSILERNPRVVDLVLGQVVILYEDE